MNSEDATTYLVSYLRSPRPGSGYSKYGYDVYMYNVIDSYLYGRGQTDSAQNQREIYELSPHFFFGSGMESLP